MTDIRLVRANKLLDSGSYEEALQCFDDYLSDHPSCKSGYRGKADAYSMLGNYVDEVSMRKRLVDLGTTEPSDYYDLARISVESGDSSGAIVAGEQCVLRCEEYNVYFYFQAANFWMTLALIAQKEFSVARKTCDILDSGYQTHVRGRGMVSKEVLEGEILKGVEQVKGKKTVWKFSD